MQEYIKLFLPVAIICAIDTLAVYFIKPDWILYAIILPMCFMEGYFVFKYVEWLAKNEE